MVDMTIVAPLLAVETYSVGVFFALLLYWNAPFIISRLLTALISSAVAMKLDFTFHLLFGGCHQMIILLFCFGTVWTSNGSMNVLQTQSQTHSITDVMSLALLVGNTVQFWIGALVTRIALSALAARAELNLRWWESQTAAEHGLLIVEALLCCAGCTLQWGYYTLLPTEERDESGEGSPLMWYTSIVHIVAVGLQSGCTLVTASMRMWGYYILLFVARKMGHNTSIALEDSGLNPFSEMHALYMRYLYAISCAAVAWYYTPSSIPFWVQLFVLLRIYLIASASGELRHYHEVLDRFPSVAADPSKECGICLDDFAEGEVVKRLPCGHTFHGACVRSWLIRSSICPTCRQSVVPPSNPYSSSVLHEGVHGIQHYSIDMGTPTVGVTFIGTLQPLPPGLPAAMPTVWPLRRHSRNSRPVSQRTPLFPVELRQLPHSEELQRVDAARRTLALCRHRTHLPPGDGATTSSIRNPQATEGDVRTSAVSTAITSTNSREDREEVDSLLFQETPLLPVESVHAPLASRAATATSAGHKRRRLPQENSSAASSANDGGDDAPTEDANTLSSSRRRKKE